MKKILFIVFVFCSLLAEAQNVYIPSSESGNITNGVFIKRKTGAWRPVSASEVKSDLALVIGDVSGLQAAIDGKLSATNSSTVTFDTSFSKPVGVGDPKTYTWMRFRPLVKADTAVNSSWYVNQGGFLNNGVTNEVYSYGWNISPGIGPVEAGKPGLGESWEQNYDIGSRLLENHKVYLRPNGTQVRLASYTINSALNTIRFYHSVDNLDFRSPNTGFPYWGAAGVSNVSTMTLGNIGVENQYFNVEGNFAEAVDREAFTISAAGAKQNRVFRLSNFSEEPTAPVVSLTNSSTKSGTIRFIGVDNNLGHIVFDSVKLDFTKVGNFPIQLNTGGAASAYFYGDKINLFQPVSIGAHTTPVAPLDVRTNSVNQPAYFEQSKTSGTSYGSIFTSLGASSGTNVGVLVGASSGAGNRAIQISNPTSEGANNYVLYSDGTAKSHHAGKLGLGSGNTTPLALLDIRNTADNQAMYMETNKTTGSAYAGIFTSLGSGGTNVGLHVGASNGASNKSIRIDNPVAGADNYSIYSASGAQSYFEGSIGVGTATPVASAKLEITSTAKGFLPPRMTKAQRDAISSPATGLVVYQTDNTPGIRVFNGTNWMRFTETAD